MVESIGENLQKRKYLQIPLIGGWIRVLTISRELEVEKVGLPEVDTISLDISIQRLAEIKYTIEKDRQ